MARRGLPSLLAALCVSAMLLVTACGGSGQSGPKGTLTIDNETGGLWTCGFNPFSTAVNFTSLGIVYEPLVYVNALNGKEQKWLATDYQWSQDHKTLTFTTRQGVKWSDGQDFTADDVVYTFNLLKQNSALDLQAVWSVLSSVQKQGTDQVVMTFKDQAVPYFFYIAGQVGIVPKHAWTNVSDPVKYDDKKPVGTGPFTVGQCTPQAITYTRNTSYWQKGKPQVDKVVYPAFTDNQPANLYLSQGKADWGGQFIPNIDSYYKAKDASNNHYWFPPTNNVSIYINQTKSSLNNKTLRQALAFAIDRAKVSRDGEYGYEPPANQTGIITPTFDNWYDSTAAKKYDYRYDPAKAASLLDQAGYKKGSDGMLHGPDGKPLSLNIINVNGNTDWVASVNIIRDNLKQVGIDLQPANLSQQDYQSRLYNGDFDLAYGTPPSSGAPAPYYELRATLYSANSAPIGQAASSNFERWQSTATDQLFDSYAATTDSAEQHRLISQIEQTMLEDVPVIPVTEGVAWYQYSSKRFDGWPTKDNPYADPAPYAFPDWEVVLLNLQPK